jgi:hypothetical protein
MVFFVRIARDPEFDAEARRLDFRHCCEDCGYYDAATGGCCHYWPNAEHRREYYQQPSTDVVFCKEFELE